MKKTFSLLTIVVLVLSAMPIVMAVSYGEGITPDIIIEDFEPRVWMCGDRILLDDATEPGRFSEDGEQLAERLQNYAFEGEQIIWDVLVMDKNGIEKIEDVFVTLGDVQGAGNDIEVNCREVNPFTANTKTDEICYKDSGTGWQCGPNPDSAYSDAEGSVRYREYGEVLEIEVNLENLKPDTSYQLTLQGRSGNDGNTELGERCDNPNAPADGYTCTWECGNWSGEGFWNFDLNAMTDSNGDFNEIYELELPIGHYGPGPATDSPIGFIVKEITNNDSCIGSDYVPVLMEKNGLEWWIVEDALLDPECNARILEEELDEFDSDIMQYYQCIFTVETSENMGGEYWVTVEATDLDYLSGTMDENEYWFFNPSIALGIDGGLFFEDARPGTSSYSETLLITNDAEDESGVLLDMFISGTDFYDSSSSGAKCPTTNQLSLDAFSYFATLGAYSTLDDNRADTEGYVPIAYGIGFNDPNPFYGNNEIMHTDVNSNGYYAGNILSPGANIALTFRLDLPEPCNGDFDSGSIYFWGEAI
jgi:hypothetical protein